MEENQTNPKKRKTMVAVIAVSSIAVILFLCIFSLYHLPTRNPVETPEWNENSSDIQSSIGDFAETNDIMSASQEELSEMLGNLEMQYENAKVNNEPYEAQQDGLRLALAYHKAGENQQAVNLINSLKENYSYDTSFVERCNRMLGIIEKGK